MKKLRNIILTLSVLSLSVCRFATSEPYIQNSRHILLFPIQRKRMPDTPGLAVWKAGHIGVYIGNGEVVEAMGTKYGVVKTQLEGRGWTHWLEVPGIEYE